MMKVTVCELSDDEKSFRHDWEALSDHIDEHQPDLLLLPEMPFGRWIAYDRNVNAGAKHEFVEKHEQWLPRMEQLNVSLIVYSKPVFHGDKYFNTACLYEEGRGHQKLHSKAFFPEEPG